MLQRVLIIFKYVILQFNIIIIIRIITAIESNWKNKLTKELVFGNSDKGADLRVDLKCTRKNILRMINPNKGKGN